MSVKYFLDTNIFIYSFDKTNPHKQEIARGLIADALASGEGVISFQVIQEFSNVALGKFKKTLSTADTREYLEQILLPLNEKYPGNDFYLNSIEIKERTGYSFYDSMIIQAALDCDCRTLYSEDMQDGFKLYDLTIRNPFS